MAVRRARSWSATFAVAVLLLPLTCGSIGVPMDAMNVGLSTHERRLLREMHGPVRAMPAPDWGRVIRAGDLARIRSIPAYQELSSYASNVNDSYRFAPMPDAIR